MSADQQRVTYKPGEEEVDIKRNAPVKSSPTDEITRISSPGSPSSGTPTSLSPQPTTYGSSQETINTDCGFIMCIINFCNTCFNTKWRVHNRPDENEVVKNERDSLTLILVYMGYILGTVGLVACLGLYISIKTSDANSKMAAWTVSPEFPVIFGSIFWCSLVSHCRSRGSCSSVPEYAPQKRGPNSGIEDDGKDYPLVKCATGTSSEESIEIMLKIGMSVKNVLAAGKTIQEMRAAGVSVKTMYEGEITVRDMYDAGVSVKMMYDEGVPVEIMRDAGISSNVLIEGGVPVEEDFGVAASETVTSAELSVCQGSGGTSLQEPYFALPM